MTEGDRLAAARGRRIDLRVALGRLEQAIATPAPGRATQWLATVDQRMGELVVALRQHVEVTEGEDGLFEEVMAQAPRLAHTIEGLRQGHQRLLAQAASLRDSLAAADAEPGTGAIDTLRKQAVELMVELVEHRHRGADLVYDAFNVDIEAVD